MSKETFQKTPLALAIGTAFTVSLAQSSVANAQDNPFGMNNLSSGYMVAQAKNGEGKCGEGKCGEGKCGGDKAAEGQGVDLTDEEKALLDTMSPEEKAQLKQSMTEMLEQMGAMSKEEKQAKMGEMTPQQQAMLKMLKAEKMAAAGDKAEGDKGKEGKCGEGKCGEGKCGGDK